MYGTVTAASVCRACNTPYDFVKTEILAMPQFLRQLVGAYHNLAAHCVLRFSNASIDVVGRDRKRMWIRLARIDVPVDGGRYSSSHGIGDLPSARITTTTRDKIIQIKQQFWPPALAMTPRPAGTPAHEN